MSTTTTCRNMVGPFLMQARAGASFTPSPGGFPHPATVTHLLVVALIEDAIDTHRPHVHIVELGPSKKFVVEFKPAFEVGRVEFVPADATGGRRCGALRRWHGRVGGENDNRSPLGIGHDGETKHAGNVGGRFP